MVRKSMFKKLAIRHRAVMLKLRRRHGRNLKEYPEEYLIYLESCHMYYTYMAIYWETLSAAPGCNPRCARRKVQGFSVLRKVSEERLKDYLEEIKSYIRQS